jgi:hypothetical protein
MADAGVGDLDQHLTFFGGSDIDLDHLQGLASFKGHGGTGFHGKLLKTQKNRWVRPRRRGKKHKRGSVYGHKTHQACSVATAR